MIDPPLRVVPALASTPRVYLMGVESLRGAPRWSRDRHRTLGWPSEAAAVAGIDGQWPELRAEMERAGTPIVFETSVLDVKPIAPQSLPR
jgi:hypothetical protein